MKSDPPLSRLSIGLAVMAIILGLIGIALSIVQSPFAVAASAAGVITLAVLIALRRRD